MDRLHLLTCVAVEQRVGALAAGAQHVLVHVASDDVLKTLGQKTALDNQPLLAVQVSARTQLLCGGETVVGRRQAASMRKQDAQESSGCHQKLASMLRCQRGTAEPP